jgi:hypothetical protein
VILSDAVAEALHNEDPLPRRLGQAAIAGLLTSPVALLGIAGVEQACFRNEGNVRSKPTDRTAAYDFCQAVIPGYPEPGLNWQAVWIGAIVAVAFGLMSLPISRVLRMMLVAALAVAVIGTGLLSNTLTAFRPTG